MSTREVLPPETRLVDVSKLDTAAIERPIPSGTNAAGFGSDVVAEALRDLDIPYIALNPGASYRGLHDSLVNHIGNASPQMLLCLHEEAAVAIAHGYAKVTGRAMAAAVHSNVGLFHATMAIFNAWCDRMPVIILGATGPVDAPPLHQVGRSAGIAGGGTGIAAAGILARQRVAPGPGLRQSRCRHAGGRAR